MSVTFCSARRICSSKLPDTMFPADRSAEIFHQQEHITKYCGHFLITITIGSAFFFYADVKIPISCMSVTHSMKIMFVA